MVGNKPFVYSSDFPHEVNNATCKEEIAEVRESTKLSTEDKAAVLHGNAERFYALGGGAAKGHRRTARVAPVLGSRSTSRARETLAARWFTRAGPPRLL